VAGIYLHEAAETLLHCLLEMGEQDSNPVLEVIEHRNKIQQEVKYPQQHLHFNGAGWRAYYHTHANKADINHLFAAEHGHFHIFVRTENEDSWSHLVALSMDEFGQPLRWFMVNHWVTAEVWCDAATLSSFLRDIPYQEQTSLLEQWLLAMLSIYPSEINDLLLKRDNVPELQLNASQRQNRDIYLLAEEKILLKDKLQQILA
jgi:hypothetical protein